LDLNYDAVKMYYQNKQKNFLKVPFTDCFLAADLVDFFMLCDDF